MSMSNTPLITISSLKFLKPNTLASSLRDPSTASSTAIIDVRDNDHMGGHIRGSQWIPINQLEARMPELLRVNRNKSRVVFHCMLSQQRGPSAALKYARARQAMVEKETITTEDEGEGEEDRKAGKLVGQEICVLEGGFENWQRVFGTDETLTEGYVKDLWD